MEQGPFSRHSVDTCSIAKSMSHVSMCGVMLYMAVVCQIL